MGGAAFETHIFGNILRYFRHRARDVDISFWRTRDGQEIDFLLVRGRQLVAIEVRSSRSIRAEDLKGLRAGQELLGDGLGLSVLLYGGDQPVVFDEKTVALGLGAFFGARGDTKPGGRTAKARR